MAQWLPRCNKCENRKIWRWNHCFFDKRGSDFVYFRYHNLWFLDGQHWLAEVQDEINGALRLKPITKRAKNVIIFIGDGMSLPTVTGARIYQAQRQGSKWGEESSLTMDTLPHFALSKVRRILSDDDIISIHVSICFPFRDICHGRTDHRFSGLCFCHLLGGQDKPLHNGLRQQCHQGQCYSQCNCLWHNIQMGSGENNSKLKLHL